MAVRLERFAELPFPLNTIVRPAGGALIGVRVVVAKPGGDTRARDRELLLLALSSTRVLDAAEFFFQDEAEAGRMTDALLRLPGAGVCVHSPAAHPDGVREYLSNHMVLEAARRSAPPDLRSEARDGLRVAFDRLAKEAADRAKAAAMAKARRRERE